MVRVWKFLVPGAGEHTLRIKALGKPQQHVSLDGADLQAKIGQTVFAGPGDTLLRLKQESERWILLVNEQKVEEIGQSCDGLRDLRSIPDGSYTIATGFSVVGLGIRRHACRKFKFLLDGVFHEVVVAQKDRAWQIALDGDLVDQESLGRLETTGQAQFDVPAAGGLHVPAVLNMTWSIMDFRWSYHLRVGQVVVPVCWTRFRGNIRRAEPPKVFSGAVLPDPTPAEAVPEVAEASNSDLLCADAASSEDGDKENESPEYLPQGVSYDREAGSFQANIKDPRTNRFVFLGEFATSDEAYEKYLQAISKYEPEKILAPSLV